MVLAQTGSGPVVGAVLRVRIPTLRLEPRPFGGADLPNCILLCVFFVGFLPWRILGRGLILPILGVRPVRAVGSRLWGARAAAPLFVCGAAVGRGHGVFVVAAPAPVQKSVGMVFL